MPVDLRRRWLSLVVALIVLCPALGAEPPSEPADFPAEIPPEHDVPLPPPNPEAEEGSAQAAPETAAPPEEVVEPSSVRDAPLAAEASPMLGSDPFPFPEGLRGRVEFWKNTFGVWSTRQVILHDVDHPGLVYETLILPGVIRSTYSKEQEAFVRSHREDLELRLKRLETMIELRAPLTDEEKELALLITTRAGTDAIRGACNRVRSQRGVRERFRRGLEISGRYDAMFRRIFREEGVPEDIAYLPHVESSFETYARSSAGAVGVWQFTRATARHYLVVGPTLDERLDPVAAARGAARYLRQAHDLLGDWALAITSYNHGMNGMAKARERYGSDFDRIVREYDGKLFGFASRNFYAEFLAAREIAGNPARYFPEGVNFEPPLALDPLVLPASLSPLRIAEKFGVPLEELAAINPAWSRRAVHGGRAVPAGTIAWLPAGTLERAAAAKAPRKKATAPKPAPAQGASPLSDFSVHVVRKGETLFEIAASYGVRLADLLLANQLSERTIIHPGQTLRVPLAR